MQQNQTTEHNIFLAVSINVYMNIYTYRQFYNSYG